MSSWIITLVIPVLIVLAVRAFPTRECLKWSWVTLAPDLDYFTWNNFIPGVPNLHRGLFHNLFILIGLLGFTAFAFHRFRGRQRAPTWSGFMATKAAAAWLLSGFYYLSHIVLDIFAGGIVPFFPVSTITWLVYFRIVVDTSTNRPDVDGGGDVVVGIPQVSDLFLWVSSEETAIVLLVGLGALLIWLDRRRRMLRSAVQSMPDVPVTYAAVKKP